MKEFLRRLWLGEEGATMVEYGLLIVLLAANLVSFVTSLKTSIGNKFNAVSAAISGS